MSHFGRLHHHYRSPHISLREVADRAGELRGQIEAFSLTDGFEHIHHFGLTGGRHSDLQTSRSQGLDHFREVFTISYDSAVRHISFHGSSESSLSFSGQIVNFMDNYHLKAFLRLLLQLLTSRNFLDEFLDNHSVVVIRLTRGHLNVEIAAENHAIDRSGTCGADFEFFVLTLNFVDGIGLVELVQQTLGHRAFATA
jgi:hypothetical protein